jgi:putative endonuclease
MIRNSVDMFNWLKQKPKIEKPKTLGQRGEEFAQEIYRQKGFEIIGENVYNEKGLRKGEIDFIAKNKQKIIFVEVKTRTTSKSKFGSAEESVNVFKQMKLLKAVKLYLLKNQNYLTLQPQIDVCVIEYNELDNSFKCAKIIMNAVEDT